jgi:signal transduction histidine kinase/ActR/RegA family two-component response regulator
MKPSMLKTELIKDKLDKMVYRTVRLALGAVALTLLLYQGWAFRENMLERLAVVAQIAGNNLTAALEFEDQRQANLLLESVKAEKDIVAVSVYDISRRFFAGFSTDTKLAQQHAPHGLWLAMAGQQSQSASGLQFNSIEHFAPIRLHGEVVGYIHIRARPNRLYEQWGASLLLILGVSLLSGWLALRGSARLQRRIVEPLIGLAESMRKLTREQDFSLRVDSSATDEIGQLTRGFNDMLTHLQEREQTLAERNEQLARSNQELELAVHEATAARLAAEQASHVKSMFLANMSHEIRTPMNGILGITEMLLDSPLQAQQKEHVRTLFSSGRALLSIINDILDFSKIEAGKLVLQPKSFELRLCLEELLALFQLEASKQGLGLTLQIDADVPAWVCADAGRLRQILANLIGNAIKFTPAGSVSLRVHTQPASAPPLPNRPNLPLIFEVADTGMGISPEQQLQIFEEFNQGDSSATRRHGGTGLGLAIALRLARLMQGDMTVNSQPGLGSTFILNVQADLGQAPPLAANLEPVRLPPAKALNQAPAAAPHTAPSAGSPAAGPRARRVLVVEDNQVNQIVVQAALERLGCQVSLVDGGADGVRAATSERYDLVLMDCQMPDIDGYEATRQIRQWEQTQENKRRLPIVALTAHAMAGDREKCESAGMDDYLTKPLSSSELKRVLTRWLTTI